MAEDRSGKDKVFGEAKFDVRGLPIMEIAKQVGEFIVNNQVGVLQLIAPTGSGKSTGLPAIIIDEVLPHLPESRFFSLQPQVMVTRQLKETMEMVTGERVGIKLARDKGKNLQGTRFAVGTLGASIMAVDYYRPTIVVLDEFDFDNDGRMTLMHDRMYRLLTDAKAKGQRLILLLTSATGDSTLAEKFYDLCPFEKLEVKSRFIEPAVASYNIGSASATSFQGILDGTLRLIVENIQNGKLRGKSLLLEVPSPRYFDQIRGELQDMLGDEGWKRVEYAGLWSQSSDAEKALLYKAAPSGDRTRILVSTEMIRRGATPRVQAVLMSGFQVRPFIDPITGLAGTRELRSSITDVKQGEGRTARFEPGLVIHLEDSKRELHCPSFLKQLEPAGFLLDLISQTEVSTFRWFGEVDMGLINKTLTELHEHKLVETVNGKTLLTEKGEIVRGIPGSLKMRLQTLDANTRGVLLPFIALSAGIGLKLFANAQTKPELATKQAPLRDSGSDFFTTLRVWNEIARILDQVKKNEQEEMEFGLRRRLQEYERDHRKALNSNNANARESAETLYREFEAETRRLLQQKLEEYVIGEAERKAKSLAFKFGLIGQELSTFLMGMFNAIEVLNGTSYSDEQGTHRIQFSLDDLSSEVPVNDSEFRRQIHGILLAGTPKQVWQQGMYSNQYRNLSSGQTLNVFPGAARGYGDYAIGVPMESSGRVWLRNVGYLTEPELVSIVKSEKPIGSSCQTGLSPVYKPEQDSVFSTSRVSLHGGMLAEEIVQDPNHSQAAELFCQWLAGQMTV